MEQKDFNPDSFQIVDNPRCPLCGKAAKVYLAKDRSFFGGNCQTCSSFFITPEAADFARNSGAHLLSAFLRKRPDPSKLEFFAIKEVRQIIEDAPRFTPLEKLDLTLRLIADKTGIPGQTATTDYTFDYPLVYAANGEEFIFYIKQLGELGYVEVTGGQYAKLTAKGYERLQKLQETFAFSNTAFIAMSFTPDLKPLYEKAIEPAVSAARFRPLIMWRHEHVNCIDDEIIAQIRKARFMVADFTGQNPGVYFESGLMQGLGRHVFWMCNEAEKDKLHFDTRQYNHIFYSDIDHAQKRLYDRIVSVVGEGKGAQIP